MMRINIYNTIQSKNALLHDDGVSIFKQVEELYQSQKQPIEIDFTDVNRLSTLFLNASFGKLLAKYGSDITSKYFIPTSYSHISSFLDKYNDMWDNVENKDNYQAYRELDFV